MDAGRVTLTVFRPADAAVATGEPNPRRSGRDTGTAAAQCVLLAVTAVLYLWNLGTSGWANSFYAAAVQADRMRAARELGWTTVAVYAPDDAESFTKAIVRLVARPRPEPA